MVVFAALTLVGLHEAGVPAWVAVGLTLVVMFVLAVGIERVVLRPLVGQPDIILFMATIGITLFLVGHRRDHLRRREQADDHRRARHSDRQLGVRARSAVSC